ncbi:2-succinyl-5-enolpyruvyl-6-hydroxy-3-cyclohexene-1-carboxylic-acid synthase [Canibacter sp. lx-45]|uniref:thiamine pyrophosphate-binding protein n=1 Tax=Canibacter zhuwentaonis TaxID=2837491 RepID=UPI001BDDAD10|nr:thiamine pyrophosphate-binding protein [Canibacter zhuwentaonis]MBT1035863.1 2-succinyl-5-enolpyruvyl-6-hydroxy-3-cyclohexene-1-carboxylic-acid synthase [Canibacter zhuwentaonis]
MHKPVNVPASVIAAAIVETLVRAGVRHFVVSPGSRSQALALEIARREQREELRLHVRVDERSAAFFALGIGRASGVAAAVLVTSGTAVANLAPAVMEAHAARVPLFLVTADRPPELHGIRASQTIKQSTVFADFLRDCEDYVAPRTVDFAGIDAGAGVGVGVGADAADTSVDVCADGVESGAGAGDGGAGVRSGDGELSRLCARVAALYKKTGGQFNGEAGGPVQLNVRLRDPLSSDLTDAAQRFVRECASYAVCDAQSAEFSTTCTNECVSGAAGASVSRDTGEKWNGAAEESASCEAGIYGAALEYILHSDKRTVIVAGSGAGTRASEFAHSAHLPLLAEVVSGARIGTESIKHYQELLADPETTELIERVVIFGHPTLTREVNALAQNTAIEIIVVDAHTSENYAANNARVVRSVALARDYDPLANHRWLGMWIAADHAFDVSCETIHEPQVELVRARGYKELSQYARQELAAARTPITRDMLARDIWQASWSHDKLFVAASRMVRHLDRVAASRPVRVYSNRGVAGIDGTVSTALGVAAVTEQRSVGAALGITRVLLGDLALLHDANALALTPGEALPRVQIFVVNDSGGTIFDSLEVKNTAAADIFERVMRTPQQLGIKNLAASFEWDYREIKTRGELAAALISAPKLPQIVEVKILPAQN